MIPNSTADLAASEAIVIQRAIATHGEFLDDVQLQLEDFTSPQAGWAYQAIRKMMVTGEAIDHFTLTMLDKRIESYIWEWSNYPTTSAEYHAHLVHEDGVRRRMLAVAGAVPQMAKDMEVTELVETVRRHVDDAAGLQRNPITFVGDALDQVIADSQQPRRVYGTPWETLTENLGGGFRPGALYVVAARPGIGKSAIALQIAAHLSRHGVVGFSSLEMPKEELIRRLITQGSGVAHQVLERGRPMSEYQLDKVQRWREEGAPVTIAIDDTSTVGVSDIKAFARNLRRNGNLTGLVIDYLQLLTGPKDMKRIEQISDMTRQLKILAREMDCPIILLSQLNRESEKRMDKRPQLADLRESGSIEQDADAVILLYKDPSYEPDPLGVLPMPIELIVAKNRHGPAQNHQLNWDGAFMLATQ